MDPRAKTAPSLLEHKGGLDKHIFPVNFITGNMINVVG
jgi:hypothetical protein